MACNNQWKWIAVIALICAQAHESYGQLTNADIIGSQGCHNNLKEKTGEVCGIVSQLPALTVTQSANRAEIERQIRENLTKLKGGSSDWGRSHGVAQDVRKSLVQAFFNGGALNEAKVQDLTDHLLNDVKNCQPGKTKSNGYKYSTTVETTPNAEFKQPVAQYTGPKRKTDADKYAASVQMSVVNGEWYTGCYVTGWKCEDAPVAQITKVDPNDAKISELLEDAAPLMVGKFKPNSTEFKDAEKAHQDFKSLLDPFTKGKNKKLQAVKIVTCSSPERNCATTSTPECQIVNQLRKYSDKDLLNPANQAILGLEPAAYSTLKQVLTDPSLGYAKNVGKIYGGETGIGYDADQNDDVGRELRTWLFLSALRGKAIKDMLAKDYPGVTFEVDPTGVADDGYGFSNAAVLPGTCGGHQGGDQFFGKYCGSSGTENSCSKNVMAVKKICSLMGARYSSLSADVSAKFDEYRKLNPNVENTVEGKYSMARYAQLNPIVKDANPTKPVDVVTNKPKNDEGYCNVYCHSFSAYCSSVEKETFMKKTITTIQNFGTGGDESKNDRKNRGSTRCPVF